MEELVKQEKCQHNFQVLPNDIKDASLLISKETYYFSAMQCNKTGDQEFSTIHWSYSAPIAPITPPPPPLPSQNLLRLSIWRLSGMRLKPTAKILLIWKRYVGQSCPRSLISQAPKIANSCWLGPVDHRKMKHYHMLA